LPKFEMMMSKCEANNKPVLAAADVHIVTVYAFLSLYLFCPRFIFGNFTYNPNNIFLNVTAMVGFTACNSIELTWH